jgi:hypothetical protein
METNWESTLNPVENAKQFAFADNNGQSDTSQIQDILPTNTNGIVPVLQYVI